MYWTIDEFEDLTKQRILERSFSHLMEQGCKSATGVDRNGVCMYQLRHDLNTANCGMGIFLKEELRRLADAEESSGWESLVNAGFVPGKNFRLCIEIQRAHDSVEKGKDFKSEIRSSFRRIAKSFGLDGGFTYA